MYALYAVGSNSPEAGGCKADSISRFKIGLNKFSNRVHKCTPYSCGCGGGLREKDIRNDQARALSQNSNFYCHQEQAEQWSDHRGHFSP